MRASDKHANTEINVAVENMICTGVLRFAEADEGGRGRYGFYDVLAVLSSDDEERQTQRRAQKIEQGTALANAVEAFIKSEDCDPRSYGAKVPVIAFHGTDFISREIAGSPT